jgi:hypothetical protein
VKAGSFLSEVMAQIRRAVDCPGANWIRSLVLRLTAWPNLAPGCADRAPRGHFTYRTEMTVALLKGQNETFIAIEARA